MQLGHLVLPEVAWAVAVQCLRVQPRRSVWKQSVTFVQVGQCEPFAQEASRVSRFCGHQLRRMRILMLSEWISHAPAERLHVGELCDMVLLGPYVFDVVARPLLRYAPIVRARP